MPALRRVATLLCAAALFGCSGESTSDVVAPDALAPQFNSSDDAASGPSASGHANWINPNSLDEIHRSFDAREKDGVVEGNVVQHNKVSGFWFKGDINCLRLLSPNEAVLSGPVRESSNPAIVGQTAIFRVGDGGEGSDDPPDRTSGLQFRPVGSTVDCNTFVNPLFTPIESGNIQVKP
jgi:hypothetical protein